MEMNSCSMTKFFLFLNTLHTDDPKSIWICSEKLDRGDETNVTVMNSVCKADIQVRHAVS